MLGQKKIEKVYIMQGIPQAHLVRKLTKRALKGGKNNCTPPPSKDSLAETGETNH